MKVVTYATNRSHPYLAHLANKLNVELLQEYMTWRRDFYPRAFSMREFVSSVNPEELVISVDAYDVFALNGCNKIKLESKIRECFDLNKITFCAETNCYPDDSLASKYPIIDSDWKYLNAGIYVGKAKLIKHMLNLTLDKMIGNMDQLQFSYLFLESNLINIDSKCQVFQSLFRQGYEEICWEDYEVKNNRITNKIFDTSPMLFHGNGLVKMHSLIPYIF